MEKNERKLSEYIDSLNEEREPAAHKNPGAASPELERLNATVRLIRSLREPALPEADYPEKVARAAAGRLSHKAPARKAKRNWLIGIAAAAAVAFLLIALNSVLPFGGTNIVYAMEQAYQKVHAYHGILEVVETNEKGEETTQAKREVWADKEGRYYVRGIEGAQKDFIAVNNGQKKWQLRPDQKQAYIFPAYPDPYLFTFELGREVGEAKNALETKTVGEEVISGRMASVLEVTPRGGVPYRLWIDNETRLPLQKQSGMQNGLEYKVTYTEIEFIDAVPAELMAYGLPEGFEEIDTNPEELVNNMQEAGEATGFAPKVPESLPAGYTGDGIAIMTDSKTVKLYYSAREKNHKVIILQGKAAGEFKPAPTAVLGTVNNNGAEILSPVEGDSGIISGGGAYAGITGITSIRWQEDGMEYAVIGDASPEELASFAGSISGGTVEIPEKDADPADKPQVDVAVDMEIEENDQKSADGGHSPWKLDPVFVAQVFVSLKMSPEGIVGEYPIQYEALKLTESTGSAAVVEVGGDTAPIARVYLKRLVRQDSTGIWTVVGYDPVDKK